MIFASLVHILKSCVPCPYMFHTMVNCLKIGVHSSYLIKDEGLGLD